MFISVVRWVFITLVALSVTVDGFDNRKCPRFQIKRHTIIRSQQSQKNGARYLGRGTVTRSRGCYEMCCGQDNCNMVMLKFEHEHKRVICFMFECGSPSKCLFYAHPSYKKYATLQFDDRDVNKSTYSSKTSKNGNHEADKEEPSTQNYQTTTASKSPFDQDGNEGHNWQSETHQTTKASTNWYHVVTTASTPHGFAKNNPGRDWMGKNVDKAQTKYHSGWKNTFRKNQDHPTHKTYATTTKAPAVKWHADSEKKTNYQGYDGSKYTFDRGHELPSLQKETNRSPSKASSEKDSEEEEFPRRVFVDNNPNYPDEPYGHFNKPRSTIKPIQTEKSMTQHIQNTIIPSQDRSEGHHWQSTIPTTKRDTTLVQQNIIRLNIRENKAVIPLAVGLVLALLLLMAVVFRLRTTRRRRTKAFLTDDADYLINGMYL